jgi:hypothetical protein
MDNNMEELLFLTRMFGPVSGMILFIIYRQLLDMIDKRTKRREEESLTKALSEMRDEIKSLRDQYAQQPKT